MRYRQISEADVFVRDYGELILLAGNTKGPMRTRKADLKILKVTPGKSTSLHCHFIAESLFHILSGTVVFSDDKGTKQRLSDGATFILDPNEFHRIENIGNRTAVILEIESPPHDSSDKYLAGTKPSGQPMRRPLGRFWKPKDRAHVKVCGIKSADAAFVCFELGVDAIGVHAVGGFETVDRMHTWSSWLTLIPNDLSIFLLVDTTDLVLLERLALWTNYDTIQIQGAKSPGDTVRVARHFRPLGYKIVKSIGLNDMSLDEAIAYVHAISSSIDAILIDSSYKGGTGKVHDWQISRQIAERAEIPVILAGGIGANNLSEAESLIHPFAIDVESSTEILLNSPGSPRLTVKSAQKIASLMQSLAKIYAKTE